MKTHIEFRPQTKISEKKWDVITNVCNGGMTVKYEVIIEFLDSILFAVCKNTWLLYNFEFYVDWIDKRAVQLEYGVEAIGPDF